MNVSMKEVVRTSRDGEEFWSMTEVYVRGNTIKYVRVPDSVLDVVAEEKQARESAVRDDILACMKIPQFTKRSTDFMRCFRSYSTILLPFVIMCCCYRGVVDVVQGRDQGVVVVVVIGTGTAEIETVAIETEGIENGIMEEAGAEAGGVVVATGEAMADRDVTIRTLFRILPILSRLEVIQSWCAH